MNNSIYLSLLEKKDRCAECESYEHSNLLSIEEKIIFREEDILREMDFEDVKRYKVNEMDLFHDEGNKEQMPTEVHVKKYVQERIDMWNIKANQNWEETEKEIGK